MTSNSSATIDPENPLKGTPQSNNNDNHTPVAKTNDEGKVETGNGNAQGEILAGHSAAGQAGEHTGQQQEELDDFGLPIRVRPSTSPSTDESDETSQTNLPDSHDSQKDQETKRELATPDETTENENQATASEDKEQHSEQGKQASDSPVEVLPAYREELSEKNQNTPRGNQTPIVTSGAAQGLQAGRTNSLENTAPNKPRASRDKTPAPKPSEWSHQRLTEAKESEDEESEESDNEWREMPALGEFDEYDDFGRLLARGAKREEEEKTHKGLGGVGKGYTRVQLDEDAQSATSLDEDTSYLFRENAGNSAGVEGEEMRDAVSQLQATKDILTEGQRIAYVGVTRLSIHQMELDLQAIPMTKGARKTIQKCRDSTKMWGQAIMARLYAHMEIDPAEQIMIEQLTQHGVQPADLVPPLMQNARIKNPLADEDGEKTKEPASPVASPVTSPATKERQSDFPTEIDRDSATPPPPYEAHEDEPPEVQSPSQLPTSTNIDIDLRWTVLCDLFLVLIADSAYDARSRALLERVGGTLEVSSLQITRFEKRVIDALEMQEEEETHETLDETENMDKRQKMAKKRRYMVMGLATVGGGLVIGLSAGLLAPVIGAGLAAGFTTVGISGTSAFLGGTGGTALIASSATMAGSTIGLRASHRRTGAVKTFEYRPLHNNRRVNLIVTVAGWMTGKVDDVRLPYSTIDPIMGDLYSVLWEPEMLRSMGETINILATEVSLL